ncbi:hypothetical protein [Rhizobium sp. BK251]|uniref:hypothetical protein n=1 Tax=Rhizobium sp. BK251 TaxID=2512125 RepID=UPI001045887F|nr:hypothetical protein [Rhizobium sp. BK251]TCL76017.1 hypothetical protein EV286_101564 [Rhizobium sp. BK251]
MLRFRNRVDCGRIVTCCHEGKMFAGRYLYWMLMCVAQFLFFAMCFDYFTWLTVAFSGCTLTAGACSPIIVLMSGTIKPLGLWAAGIVVFLLTVARIRHLSMSHAWIPVVLVWLLASAPFSLLLGNLGSVQRMTAFLLAETAPAPFLFLAAFIAYLFIAFEEDESQSPGGSPPVRLVIWVCAVYSALVALATAPDLGPAVARFFGISWVAGLLAVIQPPAAFLLSFGTEGTAPSYIAFAIFVCALVASRIPACSLEAFGRFIGLAAPRESRD